MAETDLGYQIIQSSDRVDPEPINNNFTLSDSLISDIKSLVGEMQIQLNEIEEILGAIPDNIFTEDGGQFSGSVYAINTDDQTPQIRNISWGDDDPPEDIPNGTLYFKAEE